MRWGASRGEGPIGVAADPGRSMTPSVIWSPAYEIDIGVHVFPTRKYRLVRDRLLATGAVTEDAFETPAPATDEELLLVHTPEYLRKIREDDFSMSERTRLELPFSRGVADGMRLCCGGTILAARRALRDRRAVHLGGGFHHAFPDHGEGFCLLNDIAVAAAVLLEEGAVDRIAVVDLDVHHGNGTAAAMADDDRVTTFSMHQEHNYPLEKPPSDVDVGLPDHTADADYLELLDRHLPAIVSPSTDLVLYLAGADPYREDTLGGLSLTKEGLVERDRRVRDAAREAGAAIAVTLAGGYAVRTEDTVEIHASTAEVFIRDA